MRKVVKFVSFDGLEFDSEDYCKEHEEKILNEIFVIQESVIFYDECFQKVSYCKEPINEENYYNIFPDFTYIKIIGLQDNIISLLNKYYEVTGNYRKIIGKSKYGFYMCSKTECTPADDFIDFVKKEFN